MHAMSLETGGWIGSEQITHVNRVSRPWRLFTTLTTILMLLGYLILSVAFGKSDETARVDRTAGSIVALFFIGISYASSVVIAIFQRNRKIFLMRSLFMPCLAINLVSLFNVVLNIYSRDLFPLTALRVVGIGLPCAFSATYGLAAFLIYREYGPSQGHRAEDGTPLLSEEEMQRRQLLRLLKERNTGAPSPDLIHNTYRLDIDVASLDPVPKSWDRYTSPSASSRGGTGRTFVRTM
ncbi:uncharacterized protein N7459_006401 [Penicillium hispanicum]|uniref:uncharacterized protein n=1 Tax=Penicillium hispanicum TaxID=1080232 RepID=UPI002540B238|nr:uncharacterized protein N7459_006401 [Penicillium hispanicum]KAJ5577437.1 hypothetical protein N7459_006401 [Penicillium hispanicum]